ncbi:unnamed protein product [Nesidiocoris tenuis]|uniref:Integrase catalytic domain-containing protein n=1 Tax=Nesidiocoris tenuis TaxID=355587 RepID=A0A6H5G7J3_9HEMI|nr:unnamed protein product [Nesidiocoris tenuis]
MYFGNQKSKEYLPKNDINPNKPIGRINSYDNQWPPPAAPAPSQNKLSHEDLNPSAVLSISLRPSCCWLENSANETPEQTQHDCKYWNKPDDLDATMSLNYTFHSNILELNGTCRMFTLRKPVENPVPGENIRFGIFDLSCRDFESISVNIRGTRSLDQDKDRFLGLPSCAQSSRSRSKFRMSGVIKLQYNSGATPASLLKRIVIIDDFSHFLVVKLLRTKDEAEQNLINYVNTTERQLGIKVKRFRLDNGGEFSSNNFKNFARKHGIELEYTMSYSPQSNGKSERMNRTLQNMVRTKLIDSGVPKYLWGEALKSSVYELNRSPSASLKNGETPALLWHGRNDISKARVFGCRAWLTSLPKGKKLDPRAKRGVLCGYCGGGYRIWLPNEKKVVQSRDVVFDEDTFEYKPPTAGFSPEPSKSQWVDMPSCPTITSTTNSEKADLQAPIQLPDNSDVSSSDEEEDRQNEKSPIKVSKSGRVLKKPSRLDEFELYSAYCMLSSTTEEPKTFEEARQNDEWKAAIKNELDSHKELGTWTPAKLPENKEAIDTKWVFKIKEDGTKKARLVARGFQIPYNKLEEFTYAPVCRMSTIRILISQAVIHDWPMRQIDVPTAFLNGKLEIRPLLHWTDGVCGQVRAKSQLPPVDYSASCEQIGTPVTYDFFARSITRSAFVMTWLELLGSSVPSLSGISAESIPSHFGRAK